MNWRHWFAFNQRSIWGYSIGAFLGVIGLLLLLSKTHQQWSSPGPMMVGHEKLLCNDCHRPEGGSMRQQIQANVKYWLQQRQHGAYFQFRPVTNTQCLACHERPNEHHPVQRFNEPRFSEVREKLHPELCTACHQEHQGKRVTQQSTEFCQHCHDRFALKHDTLRPSHQTLVDEKRWSSCLGCHDFHGNHEMKLAVEIDHTIAPSAIANYFNGADSPYPGKRIHSAKETLDEH